MFLRRSFPIGENDNQLIKSSIERVRINLISQMKNDKFSYIISKQNFSFGTYHKERLYELKNGEVYYFL